MRCSITRSASGATSLLEGGPIAHSAQSYVYDDIWLEGPDPRAYEMGIDGSTTDIVGPVGYGSDTKEDPGLHEGQRPGGERFATPSTGEADASWVGLGYVSPWP